MWRGCFACVAGGGRRGGGLSAGLVGYTVAISTFFADTYTLNSIIFSPAVTLFLHLLERIKQIIIPGRI